MLISQLGSDPVADLAAFSVLAFTGLVGTLWMGRLHRAVTRRCRRLEDEILRTAEASGRLESLLSDLVATFNLSLALYASDSGAQRRQEIEQLSAALQRAVDHQHPGSVASVHSGQQGAGQLW